MPWIEKETPTVFDELPLHGLLFLDGSVVAKRIEQLPPPLNTAYPLFSQEMIGSKKSPALMFPSGYEFPIWQIDENVTIHLPGISDIRLHDTADSAFAQIKIIAEQFGYALRRLSQTELEIWGQHPDEIYRLHYDQQEQRLVNIVPQQFDAQKLQRQLPLLSHELLQQFPSFDQLDEQMSRGQEALAQVKFYAPDGTWVWYGVAYERGIFYGLVSGFVVEFGTFTVEELNAARGWFNLPLERDPTFQPTSVKQLQQMHEKERYD